MIEQNILDDIAWKPKATAPRNGVVFISRIGDNLFEVREHPDFLGLGVFIARELPDRGPVIGMACDFEWCGVDDLRKWAAQQ